MEIENPTLSTKPSMIKPEDNKMEIEEKPVEKKKEEPTFKVLPNFSRVLPKQAEVITFLDENRYQPILKNRKRGIIFLRDTKPGDHEEYQTGEIPEKVESHLVPPEAFEFDEVAQAAGSK